MSIVSRYIVLSEHIAQHEKIMGRLQEKHLHRNEYTSVHVLIIAPDASVPYE